MKRLRIQYLSDIHLEYPHISMGSILTKIKPSAPILVLSGDIGNPYQDKYEILLDYSSKSFEKVFIIPGNHEYYKHGNSIEDTNGHINSICSKFKNVSFLNNSSVSYNGHKWIGTTLWSKVIPNGKWTSDLYAIDNMTVDLYNRLHETSVKFLDESLKESDEPCIVITHHVPSNDLTDPMYITPQLTCYHQWFSSNLESLLEAHGSKIAGWFYGHTHAPSDKVLDGVRFLCNPIGYKGERKNPDYEKVAEL